jgi:apoptosis-inducing factor 3
MPRHTYDVASLDELAAGSMREVEAGGSKILLIRDGDAIRAIGAVCPHAGAPLVDGVRRGERLVCPWHKATFCIRTGAVLEPPAVDRLASYDVRVDGGRVLVACPADESAPAEVAADRRVFVIVGGGAAGAVAAQTLRETGFGGRIVMLDREGRVPYDRTVLSKYFLSGENGGEKSPLQTQAFYREHRIERRAAKVVRIVPNDRRIECADGTEIRYDAALLATGAAPVRPDLPGVELKNVFLLRSRADADAILAQAERSERAVILGASFVGMGVAASLCERGLEVIVVGQERVPFEKPLGPQIGAALTALHERQGVSFRLGHRVGAIEGHGTVSGVRLDDGETLPADLVVIGFGVRPVTGYLSDIPLHDDGGIPVDAGLRAADGLYAAGDIARFPLHGDGDPIRVEHWRVAEQHGRVAALNMAGQAARYDAPPLFWTIHYLKSLEYIGHAREWDDIVVHSDLGKLEFLAYYVRNGLVVAAAGMGRDKDTASLLELFTVRRDWTPAALGDNPAAVLADLA